MPVETLFFGLVLIGLLGALSWRDLTDYRLPNWATGLLAVTGLLQSALVGVPPIAEALMAAALAGLALTSVLVVYKRFRGVDGLGIGDIKLVAAGTLWFGLAGIGPMLLIATATAGLFALHKAWRKGAFNVQERIPFGPFLAIGIFAAWVLVQTAPQL